MLENEQKRPRAPPGPCHGRYAKHVSRFSVSLPTLLTGRSLLVMVDKCRYKLPFSGVEFTDTKVFVNGQRVTFPDVVARNGAVHIVHKVLNPRHQTHRSQDFGQKLSDKSDEWDDWESWLPLWADA
jgi:hypothetical protein